MFARLQKPKQEVLEGDGYDSSFYMNSLEAKPTVLKDPILLDQLGPASNCGSTDSRDFDCHSAASSIEDGGDVAEFGKKRTMLHRGQRRSQILDSIPHLRDCESVIEVLSKKPSRKYQRKSVDVLETEEYKANRSRNNAAVRRSRIRTKIVQERREKQLNLLCDWGDRVMKFLENCPAIVNNPEYNSDVLSFNKDLEHIKRFLL